METLGALRAIISLRWRMLKNSISGGRKRDALEQMSRALALVVPILIASLSIGSFVAISIIGFMGGRAIASGLLDTAVGLFILRMVFGVASFAIIALALVTPTQSTVTRYTRLLLLPIPRRVLHLVEVLATLADPWLAVMAAGLVAFAVGMLAGGRPGAALAALISGGAGIAVLVCLSSLTGFLVAWFMKSRRRSELFTLLFVLTVSVVSFIPMYLAPIDQEGRDARRSEDRARRSRQFNVEEFNRSLPSWSRYIPSELYGRAVADGLRGETVRVAACVATLFLQAGLLYLFSSRVHARMLNSLEGDHSRRRSTGIKGPEARLPLLSPGASAVAWAQFRGALRTVRGRLTILLPGPMLGIMTFAFHRVPQENWARHAADQGYLLLGASIIFTFYSLHAVSMNFFGSDRAGFTRQLLAPLSDRDLAWGKIGGFAMIVGTGLVICLATSLAVAPSGPPAYWIATIIGGAAAFMLLCPVAIWFSAIFPVASDLGKTGSGGNPHPLPMIAGTICTALFALPVAGGIVMSEYMLKSQFSAVLLMLVYLGIAAGVGIPLVNLASRTIGARRENLALVAQGK
ncbi:MAG TPA: hypothetical protein VN700_15485 [Vicinamibacterales bacterium]|nr:hypothetical protein [Vicinamibacterales bacterium]